MSGEILSQPIDVNLPLTGLENGTSQYDVLRWSGAQWQSQTDNLLVGQTRIYDASNTFNPGVPPPANNYGYLYKKSGFAGLFWYANGGPEVDLTIGAGSGISGPVTTTMSALARWDSLTGTIIKNSSVTLNNAGEFNQLSSQDYINSTTGYKIGGEIFSNTFNNNTLVGTAAASNITSGENNIIIGVNTSSGLTTGCGNISIGNLNTSNTNTDNALAIGSDTALQTNTISLGNSTHTAINLPIQALPVYIDNAAALTAGLTEGRLYRRGVNPDSICVVNATTGANGYNDLTYFKWIESKNDLPAAVGGVITLTANTTYYFTTVIDLLGDRLLAQANTVIVGGSSENSRIKSTGLAAALITSNYSLPIRFISLEASLALNLDASGNPSQAIDWLGVNFVNCAVIGQVKSYTNFIMTDSAFLSSANLTFDGSIDTIAFDQCLFTGLAGSTIFNLPISLTINRRFRIIYSSFVVPATGTGITFNASVPDESYILDTVNFSGSGTYLLGITSGNDAANKALFTKVKGTNIDNTAINGQLYMVNNALATTISNTTDFFKGAGTTTPSPANSRYNHSNNRLTCAATIQRKYLIQATLSFQAGNNNVCVFSFYDSTLGTVREPAKTSATANTSGRAENVHLFCIVNHKSGGYIELHVRNTSGAVNVTVVDLNMSSTEL